LRPLLPYTFPSNNIAGYQTLKKIAGLNNICGVVAAGSAHPDPTNANNPELIH